MNHAGEQEIEMKHCDKGFHGEIYGETSWGSIFKSDDIFVGTEHVRWVSEKYI